MHQVVPLGVPYARVGKLYWKPTDAAFSTSIPIFVLMATKRS